MKVLLFLLCYFLDKVLLAVLELRLSCVSLLRAGIVDINHHPHPRILILGRSNFAVFSFFLSALLVLHLRNFTLLQDLEELFPVYFS